MPKINRCKQGIILACLCRHALVYVSDRPLTTWTTLVTDLAPCSYGTDTCQFKHLHMLVRKVQTGGEGGEQRAGYSYFARIPFPVVYFNLSSTTRL